jgi:hypothetical protein
VNGLDWQTVQIPMVGGLQNKQNDQVMDPPALLRAVDVTFDDLGALRPINPFYGLGTVAAGVGGDIFGGGNLSTARRLAVNGDELLLFDKDTLYSWNAQLKKWVSRGTHLAAQIDEASRFVTTDDQIAPDRAELSGVVFFSWHKVVAGNTTGYVAAVDKTTGSVLMSPQALVGYQRIRLTALTTKVLLSFFDGINGVYCYALDPASPTTALGGSSTTVQTGTGTGVMFDVVKVPGADQAVYGIRRQVTTSYDVVTMTAGLTAARSNKARDCDGPIAVSCPPTGTHVQIVRASDVNVVGDLILLSSLADVYTAQAIGIAGGVGIPFAQITAAHRSVQDSSVYRCYVFWSASESSDDTDFETTSNWVSTGNTLGTAATFMRRLGVASRAFDHDGRVFVWTAYAGASVFDGSNDARFGAQLQNTYFLYRDDAFLAAKAARFNAGGFAALTGHLPDVQSLGSGVYAHAGVERRIIQLGEKQSGYGARAPREVKVTFDSNAARRVARLGQTLYVTGGELLQYDGVRLTEAGYHLYPSYFEANSTVAGSMDLGSYTYKLTWRWDNASGEVDRSTTATTIAAETTAGRLGMAIAPAIPLYVTHKTDNEPAVEVWRTAVNPTDDAPFYLVTSKDPAALTNPNRYTPNLRTGTTLATLNDELNDSDATTRESNPENYGVLENLAPPACTIIAANADRIFLAGVAGDPHRVWYSKLREEGEVAAFNDALTVTVPPGNGAITALAFLNDTLIAFKETAIYALSGDGFNNLGQGLNYGPARVLSVDVGAIDHDSVALCDKGLIFKSRKGWYILNRGWTVDYIGAGVSGNGALDYDLATVYAVDVVEGTHQVRCVTSQPNILVFDTLVNQWATWAKTAIHATVWNGAYCLLSATGVQFEADARYGYVGGPLAGGYDIETGWIKPADLQGYIRVRAINILGVKSAGSAAHRLRIRIARDYATSYFDDRYWTINGTGEGDPVQVRIQPPIQQLQAIKIRITAYPPLVDAAPVDYAEQPMTLTGIGLEVGIKRGLHRRMPAAQRQ